MILNLLRSRRGPDERCELADGSLACCQVKAEFLFATRSVESSLSGGLPAKLAKEICESVQVSW